MAFNETYAESHRRLAALTVTAELIAPTVVGALIGNVMFI
jgi:F0F1-type ATP synthase assembly protein I